MKVLCYAQTDEQEAFMQVRISDALDKQACVAVTQAEDFYMHWNEENKEAIDDYNRRIESLGTFGDGRRLF